MLRPSALVIVLVTGCVRSSSVASPSPRSESWVGPVVVRVPESNESEEVLNLPGGALASEVALVRADGAEACFDVKMRTWQGASPEWELDLRVDGEVVTHEKAFLRPCTPGSLGPADRVPITLSCLPIDSAVTAMSTDTRDSVQVRGDRVCLAHGGVLTASTDRVTLAVSQGAKSYEFAWTFDQVGVAVP